MWYLQEPLQAEREKYNCVRWKEVYTFSSVLGIEMLFSKSPLGSLTSASIFLHLVHISQLVLGILLDSGACRSLLVSGWAQVPGWPNQTGGKDFHLMVGEEIFLSLSDLIKEMAILLLAVTVSYLMTMKEDSLQMSLMLRQSRERRSTWSLKIIRSNWLQCCMLGTCSVIGFSVYGIRNILTG